MFRHYYMSCYGSVELALTGILLAKQHLSTAVILTSILIS